MEYNAEEEQVIIDRYEQEYAIDEAIAVAKQDSIMASLMVGASAIYFAIAEVMPDRPFAQITAHCMRAGGVAMIGCGFVMSIKAASDGLQMMSEKHNLLNNIDNSDIV